MTSASAHLLPRAAAAGTLLLLAACSGTDVTEVRDPYEKTNRAIHDFNLAADRNVIGPLARGYDQVTPALAKFLLRNALDTVSLPGDFANYVLQGDADRALDTAGRLTVNLLLGAGVLDPATEIGLPRRPTDFGVTLATHGVAAGPFIMLPFLGPTTLRDAGAMPVDAALDPLTYVGAVSEGAFLGYIGIIRTGSDAIDSRAANDDLVNDILHAEGDSYVRLRSIYTQRRARLILGETGAEEPLPPIFEDEAVPAATAPP